MTIFAIEKINVTLRHFNPNNMLRNYFRQMIYLKDP